MSFGQKRRRLKRDPSPECWNTVDRQNGAMPEPSPDPSPTADADTDTDAEDVTDPTQELQLIESELVALRQEADELREQIGDPATDPGEFEDRANLLVSLETHEDLIQRFEARAEVLRQQLDEG